MRGGYLRDKLWIRPVPSVYSPEQIRLYLSKVGWKDVPEDVTRIPRSIELVEKLIRHHLLTFPWDNVGMHYTEDHHMDVSPQGVYDLLVRGGQGSYCFGQNTVLLGILRGLGYRAYSGAARTNQNWNRLGAPIDYVSHTHMVVFVQPDDESNLTYVVDVGFGSGGLVRPIPLVAGEESMVLGIGPTEVHRLIRAPLPQSSLTTSLSSNGPSGQELWTLQSWTGTKADVGTHANGPWKLIYSFSELEFFPFDATDGSFVVAKSTAGLFASQVLCVKVFEDEEGKLYRKTLYGNEVKKHVNGEVEVIRTLHSELDRVRALREIFGLKIEDKAVEYIKGRLPAFQT
ncbi:arylamine N-acetyltransferase 1 [Ephemerocybe angulata]|uniref:Arylamine N-acetyltransferase 1 n=1 Tax=Ephemerocybe angulata TaxID=980116 RepID=A0A8H6IA32_9AGAR|nr:arylamine N-acetyltransferase 1 [Tulosesus angulatus]